MSIPKTIHHIWIQGLNNLPEKELLNMTSIKNLNPNWTHILWDDEAILQFLTKYFSDTLLKKYQNIESIPSPSKISSQASKSDIARWAILSISGGCYMDLDVQCVASLDILSSKIDNKTNIIAYGEVITNNPHAGFIMSTISPDLWKNVFENVMSAKNREDIGFAFRDAMRNLSSENKFIFPENLLSIYHCGVTSICMLPIKNVSSGYVYSRMIYNFWCKYKIKIMLIAIVFIILLFISLIIYVYKFKSCETRCKK